MRFRFWDKKKMKCGEGRADEEERSQGQDFE